jgi:hypothetical protein
MKFLSHSFIAIAVVVAVGGLTSGSALAQPATPLLVPCKYPHGWNSTDAGRDVSGTPPGYEHQCVVEYYPPDLILAPCVYREVFSSINWSRLLDQPIVRVEYRCSPR